MNKDLLLNVLATIWLSLMLLAAISLVTIGVLGLWYRIRMRRLGKQGK